MTDLNSIGIELCTDAIESSARICRTCVLVQTFPEAMEVFQVGALILESNRNRMIVDLVEKMIGKLLSEGQDVSNIMTTFSIAREATTSNDADKVMQCFGLG